MEEKCIFCGLDGVIENKLAKAVFDKFPESKGHMLIMPKRHAVTFFDTTPAEKKAIIELLDRAKALLDEKYHPDGYNVVINCGQIAGQSVMHCHVHLIPRYKKATKK